MDEEKDLLDSTLGLAGCVGLLGCGGVLAAMLVLGLTAAMMGLVFWANGLNAEPPAPDPITLTLTGPEGEVEPGLLTFSGLSTPGEPVILSLNGGTRGMSTPNDAGEWSVSTNVSEGGSYEALAESATQTSGLLNFSIPVIEEATMEEEVVVPAIVYALPSLRLPDNITDPSNFTLGGSADPGTSVDVFRDGTLIGTALAGADGRWSLDAGVENYRSRFQARGIDPDGNEIGSTIAATLLVPAAANFSGEATVGDSFTVGSDGFLSTEYSWNGTGLSGATVALLANDAEVGRTVVDNDGNWTFGDTVGGPAGDYALLARLLDDDGSEIARTEAATVSIPQPIRIISIAGGESPNDFVNIVGTAPPNTAFTLVFDDGIELPVTSGATGAWSYIGRFSSGAHTVVAGDMAMRDFTVGGAVAAAEAEAGEGQLSLSFATDAGDEADAAALAGAPAVELILDASWSMTFPLDSSAEADRLTADDPDSRIAIAKAALVDLIENDIPEGTPVALRAFGNIEGNLACRTDLMQPLAPLDRDSLIGILEPLEPQFNANTAIAAALAAVPSDLGETDREKRLVLLTDGAETCGGDPLAQIEALAAEGIDVRVDIIGFAIDDEALLAEFEQWAEAGNGQFFDAADADQLAEALSSTLISRYRVLDDAGDLVTIGTVGGAPVTLPAGTYTVELLTAGGVVFDNVVVTEGDLNALVAE